MAKDRNTFAKRQREMDRKHKADQKRERRARKKDQPDDPPGPARVFDSELMPELSDSASALTSTEVSVLEIFRRFRMSPGQMLCFSRSDAEVFQMPLMSLANNGLLVAEKFTGGYSLTPAGFTAMKEVP